MEISRLKVKQDDAADQTVEWDPVLAPTQVQLVELLQFAIERSRAKKPIRIAVIISAWDLVESAYPDELGPLRWLAARLSYLDQFLRGNFEDIKFRVYGISAQGGDLRKDLKKLQEVRFASERIQIQGLDCAPHDISEPVRWALGLRDEGAHG